jgi:hypothetical protein
MKTLTIVWPIYAVIHFCDAQNQSWAPDTFFLIRYLIFRYFNACIRYRYSVTFREFCSLILDIRYRYFPIDCIQVIL